MKRIDAARHSAAVAENRLVDRLTAREQTRDFSDNPDLPESPSEDPPGMTWGDRIESLIASGDMSNSPKAREMIRTMCGAAAAATNNILWQSIADGLADQWYASNRTRDSIAARQLVNAATYADADSQPAGNDGPGDLDHDGDVDDSDRALARRAAMKSLF